MTTTVKILTSSYQKVASTGYGAVQNIGSGTAIVVLSDSAPAATDDGFYLKSGDTITPAWGDSSVYAKLANTEPVQVAVAE